MISVIMEGGEVKGLSFSNIFDRVIEGGFCFFFFLMGRYFGLYIIYSGMTLVSWGNRMAYTGCSAQHSSNAGT